MELSERYGLRVDPDALIEDISVEEALKRSPSLEDYFLMRVRNEKHPGAVKGGVSQ